MKRFLYVLVLVVLSGSVYSQVNPQNGAARANIPLYSYTDAGNGLSLNVALNYLDGNGLRVSEMASSVGTGWELNCGGAISRIQHGEADDQRENSYNFTSDYLGYLNHYYPGGYLWTPTTYSPSDVITDGGGYSPYVQNMPISQKNYKPAPQFLADREQDVFAFSFNGRSGEFVIGKNKQAKTLVDSKLKIDLVESSINNVRTSISQFTITDETGIQYVFKDLELSYVCDYTFGANIIQDNVDITTLENIGLPTLSTFTDRAGTAARLIMGIPNGDFVVNKWYLSKIVNPRTSKQIVFNYTTYEEDINADKTMDCAPNKDVTILLQRYKVRGQRISSVVLSNAESLNFIYSPFSRIDLPGENCLEQIQVNYNNNPVYSWSFGYQYFVGLDGAVMKGPNDVYSDAEKAWSRLALQTLRRTGKNGIAEPPYRFAYNLTDGVAGTIFVVPPMFSIYQDHFGYYNPNHNSTNLQEGYAKHFYALKPLSNFVTDQMQSSHASGNLSAQYGILQSITYPMGGQLSFTYEANSTPSQTQFGGVRVANTAQFDGISHSNDIIKQYKYLAADGVTSSGWGGEPYNGLNTYLYRNTVTALAIGCQAKESPAAIAKSGAAAYLANTIFWHTFSVASETAVEMELSDALGGIFVSFLTNAVLGGLSTPPDQSYSFTQCQSLSTVANNTLPWGYARTEVISLLSTDNVGKIVYEYTNPSGSSPENRLFDILTPHFIGSGRPRAVPWVYGLPKTITVYDKNNNFVKQTVNHYNLIVNTIADNNFLNRTWKAKGQIYGCTPSYTGSGSTQINQETYYPFTGHVELASTDELVYNTAQQFSTTTTNFEYDNNFQLKHQYSNNSKGERMETYFYHPYDYTQAQGALNTMNSVSGNIVAPVLSSETYINKTSGTYMVGATATDYDLFSNGDIKPKVTYAFQNPLRLASNTLSPFSTSTVQRDPSYFKQIASYNYDNNGNLIQTLTGGNAVKSSIYDYDGRLMVAAATNASYADIGYTSFEAEGGKPGSWINMSSIVDIDARTGQKCFNLSDPSNASNGYFGFSGLNSGLSYIVSYWSKSGTPCITGAINGQTITNTCQGGSGWKQGATVKGWTHYEVQINNVERISVSGSGLIDEFRIYPVGAQMTTTTYTPLIGKTSECDASGRVIYYAYDDLGRLIKVSDDQGNVIRTYEYNYIQ